MVFFELTKSASVLKIDVDVVLERVQAMSHQVELILGDVPAITEEITNHVGDDQAAVVFAPGAFRIHSREQVPGGPAIFEDNAGLDELA
jgi:hypothetical protein